MSHQSQIHATRRSKRRSARGKRQTRPLAQVLAAGPGVLAYPGYPDPQHGIDARTLVTGSFAALLHAGGFALLVLFASLVPVIEERIIEVQILHEEPLPPDEPAPAPKALAERRNLPFAPAVQAVAPQIVNPRIIAEAAPAIAADALQMDALRSSTAPTDLQHAAPVVVERVSVVDSAARARAADVDVAQITSPAVRGPTRVDAPVGPSVGPRRVEAAAVGNTMGTAPLQIGSGNGSSVRDGVLSSRDVIGSPEGALVVSVDTSIGQGSVAGSAPAGTGTQGAPPAACLQRSAVQAYISDVRERTVARWVLPPGVDAGREVKLRFLLDVAGSASSVTILSAEDNALGASAVDALRSASPFPPMPEEVRCLARVPIIGTFSNPVGG